VTQELTCKGLWKDQSQVKDETAHLQLTTHRWWVGLWSKHDGSARIQFDNVPAQYHISDIEKINEGSLALYTFNRWASGFPRGGYQVANSKLILGVSHNRRFVSTTCV